MYVFSRPLAFATIRVAGILPAIRGRDALDTLATHFPLTLLGGSLIPIVVYRDEDGFSLLRSGRIATIVSDVICSALCKVPDLILW